jgi:hypothetical protein
VAADVGDQFDAIRRAHERAPLAFLRQCVVVARLRNGQFVPQVTGPVLEDELHLAGEERLVEVAVNGKLACGLL